MYSNHITTGNIQTIYQAIRQDLRILDSGIFGAPMRRPLVNYGDKIAVKTSGLAGRASDVSDIKKLAHDTAQQTERNYITTTSSRTFVFTPLVWSTLHNVGEYQETDNLSTSVAKYMNNVGVVMDQWSFFGQKDPGNTISINYGYFDNPNLVDFGSTPLVAGDEIATIIQTMETLARSVKVATKCRDTDVKFIFSGDIVKEALGNLYGTALQTGRDVIKRIFPQTAVEGRQRLFGELDDSTTDGQTDSIISAFCAPRTRLHISQSPEITGTGVNTERDYTWTKFKHGSVGCQIIDSGSAIFTKITNPVIV